MDVKKLLTATTLSLGLAGTALAQSGDQVQLKVTQSDTYGSYITDAEGRTLYLFTTDTQGDGKSAAQSSCYNGCAKAWPPLTTEEQPEAGEKLQQDLLGTFERKDGKSQVTYGGWPLYYFVKDTGAGSVTGQDKHGFGGEWYLLAPDGTKNEKQKDKKEKHNGSH
tara:strand:+ start:516 stop:1010 length:495 start_codon:yes stop_codon:yes gene_type:complete